MKKQHTATTIDETVVFFIEQVTLRHMETQERERERNEIHEKWIDGCLAESAINVEKSRKIEISLFYACGCVLYSVLYK